jgi:diguanylate cyclase (GGDEF)-like protein
MRRRLSWLLCLLALAGGAAARTPAQQAEHWLRIGYDRPDAAFAALALAQAEAPAQARLWQRTRAWVAARAGRDQELAAALEALRQLPAPQQPLAAADAQLAHALQAEQRGQSVQASTHAQMASDTYARLCARGDAADCDRGGAVMALLLQARRDGEEGDLSAAAERASEAVALAQRSDDPALLARSLAALARQRANSQQGSEARRLLAQAEALLRQADRPDEQVRVAMLAAGAADTLGDKAGHERAIHAALHHAAVAQSPRLESLALANLSDLLLRRGQAAQALAAVQRALPAARRHGDRRVERVLLHNGALALIGMGRVAEARVQAERMLELWAAEGTLGEQAYALREVADTLADAGHPRAALDLHHRERALNEQLMAAQRDSAERSLRVRYDRDSDQRRIELAARDNAIAASELNNRELAQRLWALAAAVVGAATLLVALLLRRVRTTQRSLERSQARLREQSEIDPLTGIANRRCGQQRLAAIGAPAASGDAADFHGALLLIDVDHFKRINDGQGHAAGDLVLVEVARRLHGAVRGGDLLVRWGGEEFLVIAPDVAGPALEELAQRLLRAVGQAPVELADGGRLAVTVSIGHAAFPLAPRAEPIGWERALNLTDMALYTAKSQGRARAVGLRALADAPDALARAESDFERAWSEGFVQLSVSS